MIKKLFFVLILGCVLVNFYGCASTGKLVEHASLQTEAKMSDSIFLNLALPRLIYVKISNTSDVQNIPLETAIREKLMKKGLKIVDNPQDASWILYVNLRTLTYTKESPGAKEGAVAGAGIGGVLGGIAGLGGGRDSHYIGAAVGSVVGNIAGAVTGALFKIESYSGVIDIQVQEKIQGKVKGKMVASTKYGSSATMTTEREIETEYQTYNTQINVLAKRTNINLEEAIKELVEKVSDQIASLF